MAFDWTIQIDTLVQVVSIAVAAITFIIAQRAEHKRRWEADNREVYQRLELAAIDLYRFDSEHPEVSKHIWEEGVPLPPTGTALRFGVESCVCQHL